MAIVYVTAGAGGTLCGNCLQDNALAAALRRQGHDVVLQPTYTPIRTDEADVSERRVLLGGLNLYLQHKSPLFRRLPGVFDRLLDHPALLRFISRFAVKTRAEELGALTLATLEGEDGPLRREIQKFIRELRTLRPALVHLTNSMLAALAPAVKREFEVPVVCSLQGEDYFLEQLPEPYRNQCYERLQIAAQSVDRFVAPCRAQAASMAPHLGIRAEEAAIIYPGVNLADISLASPDPERFTIGYLARIAPDKGLSLLIDAFELLAAREEPGIRPARLRAAGWLSPEHEPYFLELERRARASRFGDRIALKAYVERPQKLDLLASLDALSVPTLYGASKGLYVLEAWAGGVPVAQPSVGVFPELLKATPAGFLCEPNDPASLAAALERLRDAPPALRGADLRRAAADHFSIERMAREIASLYEAIASARA